jgi:hypothetical protein
MHNQKNSGIEGDLTETRCALATATCLQHPERLAEARSALICAPGPSPWPSAWCGPPDRGGRDIWKPIGLQRGAE